MHDVVVQIVRQRQITRSYLDQRIGKVPLSVVRNLEHASKETEVRPHNYMHACSGVGITAVLQHLRLSATLSFLLWCDLDFA